MRLLGRLFRREQPETRLRQIPPPPPPLAAPQVALPPPLPLEGPPSALRPGLSLGFDDGSVSRLPDDPALQVRAAYLIRNLLPPPPPPAQRGETSGSPV